MPTPLIPLNDLKRHFAVCRDLVEQATARALRSGWYVMGPELRSFEAEFGAHCGVPYCVGVANGTDALELALRACGVVRPSKVITVANAGAYATSAILAVGAEPLYVDVDSEHLLLDVDRLSRTLHKVANVSAIVVTHLYGRVLPGIKDVVSLAKDLGIAVIEDCAQAHGALLNGRSAGSFGDVAAFSFYPTKNLGAMGDGGALVTSSREIYELLEQLRQYGWSKKYQIEVPGGRNSRLDEIQAAILRAKLPLLETWNSRRRHIANQLTLGIRHPNIELPAKFDKSSVAHLYVIRTKHRASLRDHLHACGVATEVHYPLLDCQQRAYARYSEQATELTISRHACDEIVSLPCFPEMTDGEVSAVIDAVNSWDFKCFP